MYPQVKGLLERMNEAGKIKGGQAVFKVKDPNPA
jgi:hypothetical protein